jgi:copper(I)-binding protein
MGNDPTMLKKSGAARGATFSRMAPSAGRANLFALLAPFMIAGSFFAEATAKDARLTTASAEPRIEHAELVLPVDPAATVDAFLVVWNGTSRNVELRDITSPAFAGIAAVRGRHDDRWPTGGQENQILVPSRSELLMRERGVHLVVRRSGIELLPGQQVPVTVGFDDRKTLTIMAAVKSPGERIEDHHHEN